MHAQHARWISLLAGIVACVAAHGAYSEDSTTSSDSTTPIIPQAHDRPKIGLNLGGAAACVSRWKGHPGVAKSQHFGVPYSNTQTRDAGEKIHLMLGGDWPESAIGTNGIGMALTTHAPHRRTKSGLCGAQHRWHGYCTHWLRVEWGPL